MAQQGWRRAAMVAVTAALLSRMGGVSAGAQAHTPVRPAAPVPATRVPAARSALAALSWRLGQEAWLSIPRLGLHRRVYAGGQAALDAGLVTHYRAAGVPAPVPAGASGVYWLAGHRTTHGAPFAELGGLDVGDRVVVTTRAGSVVYRITDVVRTGTAITPGLFYGPHRGAARLMLQTCDGESHRLLAFGEKVG